MNFICKCCMQWVYCRASAAYFCFSWQARRKKMPIWILWNPSSSGKGTSESLSLLSLSFIILFFYTAYRLALHFLPPPFYCLVFSVSLCSDLRCYSLTSTLFYSVFLLFFFSLLPHFSVPRFRSMGEFWIRDAFWCQAATKLHINKKNGWTHNESSMGIFFQLVCHALFSCGGKESISLTAPLHHH